MSLFGLRCAFCWNESNVCTCCCSCQPEPLVQPVSCATGHYLVYEKLVFIEQSKSMENKCTISLRTRAFRVNIHLWTALPHYLCISVTFLDRRFAHASHSNLKKNKILTKNAISYPKLPTYPKIHLSWEKHCASLNAQHITIRSPGILN